MRGNKNNNNNDDGDDDDDPDDDDDNDGGGGGNNKQRRRRQQQQQQQQQGPIPTEIGQLAQMTHLTLSKNRLNGASPRLPLSLSRGRLVFIFSFVFGDKRGRRFVCSFVILATEAGVSPGFASGLRSCVCRLPCHGTAGNVPTQIGQLARLTEFSICDNQLIGAYRFRCCSRSHSWLVGCEMLYH
jgi:hypothetical protein